jgi:hypothetical protein
MTRISPTDKVSDWNYKATFSAAPPEEWTSAVKVKPFTSAALDLIA